MRVGIWWCLFQRRKWQPTPAFLPEESHGLFQCSSVAQSCPTLCDPMDCSTPGLPVHHQLSEFTHSCPLSWWCHATISSSVIPFSSCLQSFPASGLFKWVSSLHQVAKDWCWSFSFDISPSNKYSGLISFRMDWLDLFAIYGTLKSLLQHHSSKASILKRSAFFTVQLSHPYMTTGKAIALTIQTFFWQSDASGF